MIPPRPRELNRGAMPGGWWSRRGTPLTRRVRDMVAARVHPVAPFLRAIRHGRDLERTAGADGPDPEREREVLACVIYRGERRLLPFLLAHHRRIGIERFVFLDLSADGGLGALLGTERNCSAWRPRPGRPERIECWINVLLFRHGRNRWCLTLDATDLLVFSRSETRSVRSLTDFLETEHRDHAFGIVVEMYGDGPAAAAACGTVDPFAVLPFFDPVGYVTAEPAADGTVRVAGGPRRRTLFRTVPGSAPGLDRIPLVRWRRHFSYVDGTRSLQPRRLNRPHAPWHGSPTVCLLRFGLLGDGGTAPGDAHRDALGRQDLRTNASRRYRSSEDLVDSGLLNPGQWF